MYVTDYVDNTKYKQSSVMDFAEYLKKENLVQEGLGDTTSRQLSAYLDKQNDVVRVEGHEYFFNGSGNTFDCEDVTKAIDANVKDLKKKEARYYTFSISPSAQEIAHLRRTIADTRQALIDAGEVIPADLEDNLMRTYLKNYAVKCMDAYARNFGHPQIKDNNDLLWFGMVEKDRYWKKGDPEVRKNARIQNEIEKLRQTITEENSKEVNRKIVALEKKCVRENMVRVGGSQEILQPMMAKAGDNWHIHIAVSRRDATNSFNLSPNANGRGSKNHVLNGQKVRIGFNREAFKIECEHIFDKTFSHRRLLTESYEEAKRLRKKSAYAYERQLQKDRIVRRKEALEFSRLKIGSYAEYYENLLQCESLDARQLYHVKGQLVRHIKALSSDANADELMEYSLDELQMELARLDTMQGLAMPAWAEGVAANAGDKTIQAAGFQGYSPIYTTHKLLKHGIVMRRAIDRRREVFDNWVGIYSNSWYRENYLFDSIKEHRDTDCLLAKSEFLEEKIGRSIIMDNADRYMAEQEGHLTADFIKEYWPERQQEIINLQAVEIFGQDAGGIRDMQGFEHVASERLLPEDARKCLAEVAKRCEQPRNLDILKSQIASMRAERAQDLTARLDSYMTERGQRIGHWKEIVSDKTMSVHAKEENILRLALEDKELNKAIRDLRQGIVNILEEEHPDMKYGVLRTELAEIFEGLEKVQIERQAEFAKVIELFIESELPDYYVVVEKQSQLEQLLRELTPDQEKYAERLLDANNELMRKLSPYSENLFERYGMRHFGPDVRLKNEHEFVAYVDKSLSPEQAQYYKKTLQDKLNPLIEEKRRELIQEYVSAKIPSKELAKVHHQQNYINRYINRQFSPAVAKTHKEEVQRRVAAACKRPIIPTPEYKVFGHSARQKVAEQAMAKANQVKVMPITPQQVLIKGAFKLLNVLTKGY